MTGRCLKDREGPSSALPHARSGAEGGESGGDDGRDGLKDVLDEFFL